MTMSVLLFSVTCVLLVVIYLYYRWQYRNILAAAASLPSPPSLPLLGNVLLLAADNATINKKITDLALRYKGTFCLWKGPSPIFVISCATDVKRVLTNSSALEKDISYHYLKPFLGNGILTGPATSWKKYRRLIDPIFHQSNLKEFITVFNKVSRNFTTTCKDKNIQQPVNPKEALGSSVLMAAFNTIIGRRIKMEQSIKNMVLYLLDWVGTTFITRILNPLLHYDITFQMIYRKDVKRSMQCLSDIHNYIRQELKNFQLHSKEYKECNKDDGTTYPTMMNLIMNDSFRNVFEDHWMEELLTVLAGATDTVVSSMMFLLFTLANHPTIQAKIYSEIQEVIGDSKDDVTFEDLQRMGYLRLVILESIRLHGAIPIIMRLTTGSIKLGDVTLPPGCRVIISLHAGGWDPEVFPDAHHFRPERFSSDLNQKVRPIDAFMPFRAGPRNCIGKMYSMLLMKCMIVNVIRQFTIKTPMKMEDVEYELKMVLHPKKTFICKFRGAIMKAQHYTT